jgi:hypothetical protein
MTLNIDVFKVLCVNTKKKIWQDGGTLVVAGKRLSTSVRYVFLLPPVCDQPRSGEARAHPGRRREMRRHFTATRWSLYARNRLGFLMLVGRTYNCEIYCTTLDNLCETPSRRSVPLFLVMVWFPSTTSPEKAGHISLDILRKVSC